MSDACGFGVLGTEAARVVGYEAQVGVGATVFTVTRRKTPQEQRMRRYLTVVAANEKHARSTTQREDAAAELGLTVSEFLAVLEEARTMGFDIDRYPPITRTN